MEVVLKISVLMRLKTASIMSRIFEVVIRV